jgi:hypothetical protein
LRGGLIFRTGEGWFSVPLAAPGFREQHSPLGFALKSPTTRALRRENIRVSLSRSGLEILPLRPILSKTFRLREFGAEVWILFKEIFSSRNKGQSYLVSRMLSPAAIAGARSRSIAALPQAARPSILGCRSALKHRMVKMQATLVASLRFRPIPRRESCAVGGCRPPQPTPYKLENGRFADVTEPSTQHPASLKQSLRVRFEPQRACRAGRPLHPHDDALPDDAPGTAEP